MSYNVKNYTEQGGEKTVIGGTLEVLDGATVTGVIATANATTLGGIKASPRGTGDTVEVKIDSTTSKLYVAPPALATENAAGLVKMAANVAAINGETVTVEKFNALLTALINAGIMANEEEE